MLKTLAVERFSSKYKKKVVKELLNGSSVVITCRKYKLSRTTLYRWLKLYGRKAYSNIDVNRIIFKPRISKRKTKTAKKRYKQIKNLAINNPNYSIRRIAYIAGVSLGSAWKILKNESLETKSKRNYVSGFYKNKTYRFLNLEEKQIILNKYFEGDSIRQLCIKHSLSRTSFYKWLGEYKKGALNTDYNKRPRGKHHWRYIRGVEDYVLELVRFNPALSLNKIHKEILKDKELRISRSGLYYVLKRLNLNTYEKRIEYLRLHTIVSNHVFQVLGIFLPRMARYSFYSFLSPPFGRIVGYLSIYVVIPIIVFLAVCCILIFIHFYPWPILSFRIEVVWYLISFCLGAVWFFYFFTREAGFKLYLVFYHRVNIRKKLWLGIVSLIALFSLIVPSVSVLKMNYSFAPVSRNESQINKGSLNLFNLPCRQKLNNLCSEPDKLSGEEGRSYVVVEGDSLWSIAESEYGNGFGWHYIKEANDIVNGDYIETGRKLVIPAILSADLKESYIEGSGIGKVSGKHVHVVGEFDTLWSIAELFYGDGNLWRRISVENNLSNPDLIYQGDKLRIPGL